MQYNTQPTPSPSPVEDQLDRQDVVTWFSNVTGGLGDFAITLLVCVLLWAIGMLTIQVVKRSMERGMPATRRARRALASARLGSDPDSPEHQLERERRRQRAGTITAVMRSALAVLIIVVAVGSFLSLLGLPLATLFASAGIAGVALGFGAQSLVKDVLAGTFMLLEDQYGVGDVVDLGEARGTVEEFGLRTTRIRSLDGTVWYVPNGQIQRVGNMTRLWSRALIEVRLAYDTDLDAARTALLESVAAAREADPLVDSAILSGPEIPGVESLEYDAVVMRVLLQVTPGKQWTVMRAVRIEMRKTLAEHGVKIAVPLRTVYLNELAGEGIVEPNEDERP